MDSYTSNPTIYIAGKPHRYKELLQIAQNLEDDYGIYHTSTWLDMAERKEITYLSPPEDLTTLWQFCIKDVKSSDALFLFCKEGDTLKGCLVECGSALAMNIPIFVIGSCHSIRAGNESDASFVNHPLWYNVESVAEAVDIYFKRYHWE